MIEIMTPAAMTAARRLVNRIAVGDRAAFRRLYALLHRRVWHTAIQALPCSADTRAVTRSTFVEVWHMARYHNNDPPTDLHVWVAAITAGQIRERLRLLDTPHTFLADYDRHVHCQLAELLGPGQATIRTEPITSAPVSTASTASGGPGRSLPKTHQPTWRSNAHRGARPRCPVSGSQAAHFTCGGAMPAGGPLRSPRFRRTTRSR